MSSLNRFRTRSVQFSIPTAIAATAVASTLLLSGCGGSSNSNSSSNNSAPAAPTYTVSGVVAASGYVPGSTTGVPTIKAGYYSGAVVCIDANGNGVCDSTETQATTDSSGKFSLTSTTQNPALLADIGTSATNTATGATVTSRIALRASIDQVTAAPTAVVISPMSSEVQRLVEANGTSFSAESTNLAIKLGTDNALADPSTLSGTAQAAVLTEDNALTNRYTYATLKLDRGDQCWVNSTTGLCDDALAVPGGDPTLLTLQSPASFSITQGALNPAPAVSATPITFLQAQQAAFNIEGIPAYDAVFVIMMENHSPGTSQGAPGLLTGGYAPNILNYLNTYNQASTYYSTGNPSEPNYTALGGGDDWGITDDNWWACGTTGPGNAAYPTDVAFGGGTASDGQPLPAQGAIPPATWTDSLGKSQSLLSGGTSCVKAPGVGNVVHNAQGDSLFTLLSKAGLSWRSYSESMTPGQDPRVDSVMDSSNVVTGVYNGPGGNGTAYPAPDALYKTKHHPGMAYQDTRNLPEFFADNRTIFGTQYGAAQLSKSIVNKIPSGYNYDQFTTDLISGDVGNINFIMPDQCDDMHGTGPDPSCASGSTAIIQRGDDYVHQVVQKIQESSLWNNPQKHVAIVVVFDEGEGNSNSCCGWNPVNSNQNQAPLNASGAPVPTVAYYQGNHGHGVSIFNVITNAGPKQVLDTDAYSHFSFVRTLQDMFQLADPAVPLSYLNRARYTESFIAQNITNLPELAGSADTHFESVRPMNHAYVMPTAYVSVIDGAYGAGAGWLDTTNFGGLTITPGVSTLSSTSWPAPGSEANHTSLWAQK